MSDHLANLDRRVRVVSEIEGKRINVFREVSELRSSPFIVLLGEPGIGKSTVLSQEAAHEGTTVLTVWDLVTGLEAASGDALFVDALDEYRIDGAPMDKVFALGKVLRDAKPARWRLTCRSEDWRSGADMTAIGASAAGQPNY